MYLSDCDLSCRTYNCLARADIHTLEQLSEMTESQFIRIRNLGRMSIQEILGLMKSKGIKFKEEEDY